MKISALVSKDEETIWVKLLYVQVCACAGRGDSLTFWSLEASWLGRHEGSLGRGKNLCLIMCKGRDLCKAKWLVSGRAWQGALAARSLARTYFPPTYCHCQWSDKQQLPAPYTKDWHISTPSGRLAYGTVSMRMCGSFWLRKAECDFMEIGLGVAINLAVVGHIQWQVTILFWKKLNLREDWE